MLSVLRFLHHLMTLHGWTGFSRHSIYCDNQSMVDEAGRLPPDWTKTPNRTQASDWDVLAEIWATLALLPNASRPHINHIKGHQDKKKPYAELSLPAQLNCDADKLAGEYIDQHMDKHYSRVPILPTSGIQLQLPAGTVTYNTKRELSEARTAEPLAAKLRCDNDWSQETFDDIAWEPHRRALNRNPKCKRQLIKHLHNLTPVGHVAHRNDPTKYSPHCPSCDEPDERWHHLYTCPSRENWRKQFLVNVKEKLEKLKTETGLMELILTGLRVPLYPEQEFYFSEELADQVEAQELIGFDHLLKGRISKQWIDRQRIHAGPNPTRSKSCALGQPTSLTTYSNSGWLSGPTATKTDMAGMLLAQGSSVTSMPFMN